MPDPLLDAATEAVEIAEALARLDQDRYGSQIAPHGPIPKTLHIGEVLAPWLLERLAQVRREGAVEALRDAAEALYSRNLNPLSHATWLRARAAEIEAGR